MIGGVPARLAAFAGALAAVFAGAAALGAVVDPAEPAASCAPAHGIGHEPFGLSLTQGDTSIAPSTFTAAAGRPTQLRFQVLGDDGTPLRDEFEVEAERRMHVIVARRDLTGYQHLHPTLAPDGTWSVSLTVPEPGAYRVFADFQVDCRKHVLAADLLAAGSFRPEGLAAPVRSARVEGFDVRLEADELRAGEESALHFTVERDGRPVGELEPYLGARGHLVALRQGDLAYLHAHPEDHVDAANAIAFAADFPSAGAYRLFLQFQVAGTVHTTAFTVEVTR